MLKIFLRIIVTFGMLGIIFQSGVTRVDYLIYTFLVLLVFNIIVPDKVLFGNKQEILSDNILAQIFIIGTGIVFLLFSLAFIISKLLKLN
jgi:hypothetical protein